MKDLKEEDLDRAVSLMQSADSLYIMSMRMGFSLAYYAFASWGRLRRDIRLLRFTGMEYPEEMVSMKRGTYASSLHSHGSPPLQSIFSNG